MRTIRSKAWVLRLAAAAVTASCSAKDLPPPGEVMVVVTTDASPPKDIDDLHVQVLSGGTYIFDGDYALGPGQLLVPATIGLVAGRDPSVPATIRVYARQGGITGKVRVVREATMTVPTDRVAMVQLPINWLCYDDGYSDLPDSTGHDTVTDNKCDAGTTCAAGRCIDTSTADASTLPPFSPEAVFGGGTGDGDGTCFDTLACFAAAMLAAPVVGDAGDCTIPKPDGGAGVNVAMQTAKGAGVCAPAGAPCLIALDGEGPEGWQTSPTDPSTIELPPEVCARLTNGKLAGVFTSTSCPTKQASTPPCGPWSSVGTSVQDGGAD